MDTTTSEAPQTQAQATAPVVDPGPPCDWTAIDAALPPDTADATYTLVRGQGELCDGPWAAAGVAYGGGAFVPAFRPSGS